MERASFFQDLSIPEFQERVAQHIEAINLALEGIPRDRVRLHSCWGNRDGTAYRRRGSRARPAASARSEGGGRSASRSRTRAIRTRSTLSEAEGIPGDLVVVAGGHRGRPTTTSSTRRWSSGASSRPPARWATGSASSRGWTAASGTFAGDSFVAEDVVWAKLATPRRGGRSSPPRRSGSAGAPGTGPPASRLAKQGPPGPRGARRGCRPGGRDSRPAAGRIEARGIFPIGGSRCEPFGVDNGGHEPPSLRAARVPPGRLRAASERTRARGSRPVSSRRSSSTG